MTIKDFAAHFWEQVDKSGGPDACWPWMKSRRTNGYGQIGIPRPVKSQYRRRMMQAHRVAYQLTYGDPGELVVRHICDNPPCVNPRHLLIGTLADNMHDIAEHGHSKRFRLTIRDVLDIKRRLASGERAGAIAASFGIPKNTVYSIKSGHTWRSVRLEGTATTTENGESRADRQS